MDRKYLFCFSPLIQKEIDNIKDYCNNHPISRLVQLDRESRPAAQPDVHYFVRGSSSEYLLKYNNQNILLVGKESCTDEKNTPYGQPEADSSTQAILQEIYKLVADAWR